LAANPIPVRLRMLDDEPRRPVADPMVRLARAEGYTLLGELLLYGATPALAARAADVEPFASHLAGADFDEVGAEHHRLFEREVYPYASIFLAPGSNTGGEVADLASATALDLGIERATFDVSEDHLGSLLVLLGRIAHTELNAEAMGNGPLAGVCRDYSARLLDEGLLSWVAVMRAALAHEPSSLWTDVVHVAHELARAHRTELFGAGPRALPAGPALPATPALLDEESTRLRDIARFVLTPCHAGVFLSIAAVTGVARGAELPTGFGSREQRLTGLLQSAADYGDPPAILRALASAVYDAAARLQGLGGDVDDGAVQVFAARAAATSAMLRDAAERAAQARADA